MRFSLLALLAVVACEPEPSVCGAGSDCIDTDPVDTDEVDTDTADTEVATLEFTNRSKVELWCQPTDGPAVKVTVGVQEIQDDYDVCTDPLESESLVLELWGSFDPAELVGQTFTIDADNWEGGIATVTLAATSTLGTGTVSITAIDEYGTLSGSYDLDFGGVGIAEGVFASSDCLDFDGFGCG